MLRLAAVVLLLALAGCFGGGSGPDDGDGKPAPPSTSSSSATSTGPLPVAPRPVLDLLLAFELAPCRGVSLAAAAPLDDVQALLPSGFTAEPASFVPGGDLGVLGVDVYSCDNLTTPFAVVPNTFYGQVYTLVEAPGERVPNAPTADRHEYVFRVLASDDILAVLWRAAGYDTSNGSASVSVASPFGLPSDAGVRMGSSTIGAGYSGMATGQRNAPAAVAGTGSFARYTVLADESLLVWTGRYEFPAPANGEGSADVPADDVFAPFEAPFGRLQGVARLTDSGGLFDMDLRRVFPLPG